MWYSEWYGERCEWWHIYTHWDRLQHQYGKIPSMGPQPLLITQTVAENSQFFTSAQWQSNALVIGDIFGVGLSFGEHPDTSTGTVQTSSFNTQRLTHVWMTVLFEYLNLKRSCPTCHCSSCCDSCIFCCIASMSWESRFIRSNRAFASSISKLFFLQNTEASMK